MNDDAINGGLIGFLIGAALALIITMLVVSGSARIEDENLDKVCVVLTKDNTARYIDEEDRNKGFICETDTAIHSILKTDEDVEDKRRINWEK